MLNDSLVVYLPDFLVVSISLILSVAIFFTLLAMISLLLAVSDFDAVCDSQARAVKNSEAVRKKRAAGSAKEGVASQDDGNPSDGEEVGNVAGGDVEPVQLTVPQGVTTNAPPASISSTSISARKGKGKVGAPGLGADVPVFDASVPETPLDPTSDLNPRSGRGKRPAEGPPDSTVRPPQAGFEGRSVCSFIR